MDIINGYRGEPHITSQQERDINVGIFGATTQIIKSVGSELAATIISANEVEIADGLCLCQGCAAEVTYGTTESVTIENGEQGLSRRDLIVVRYTKDAGTGVEDMSLEVIKGTPVASNPQTPSYTTGLIADGATTVDFPLYRVNISGISITSLTRLAGVINVPSLEYVDTHRIKRIASGYQSTSKNLGTAYTIVPMDGDYTVGDAFARTNDGGYRVLRSGLVLVSAFCAIRDVNANDSALVCIGRYNGGWVYESNGRFAVGTTERSCDIATFPMVVSQNDVIYLRARNSTAARGSVGSGRILLELVN